MAHIYMEIDDKVHGLLKKSALKNKVTIKSIVTKLIAEYVSKK